MSQITVWLWPYPIRTNEDPIVLEYDVVLFDK